MYTQDLHYDLPEELIATQPAEKRSQSRLLVMDRNAEMNGQAASLTHKQVSDLPLLLAENRKKRGQQGPDLLIFNQSRVLPAFLTLVRSATGGKVTGLFLSENIREGKRYWRAMLESRGKLQPGEKLAFPVDGEPAYVLTLIERIEAGTWLMSVTLGGAQVGAASGISDISDISDISAMAILEVIGKTPIPPYIRKKRKLQGELEISDEDARRYNTVYASDAEMHREEVGDSAQEIGLASVAAPTAGLHFTDELMDALKADGVQVDFVTLHVGHGTFAPVRTDIVEDHPIHQEWIDISAQTQAKIAEVRQQGGRILPIGTTTVRALESLPEERGDAFERVCKPTDLFITPDKVASGEFSFRYTDALFTNFHLPESTLLALVAALPGVGLDNLKAWYALAIDQKYRFYSYGDAMLVL